MNDNILIDIINIKTLPEMIINYLKNNNIDSNLNSIRNIYSLILSEISIDIKDSYLNKIQKYLSSNEACQILVFDDITDGIYDKELINACNIIVSEINKSIDNVTFYQELLNKCYFIHFEDDELDIITKYFNNCDYNNYMFNLFKHAIKNYKISTPKILAQRLLGDATTLTNDIPIKKFLFKMSADLGNPFAAFRYANCVTDQDERIEYFVKGKELEICLWQIGYLIEHFRLSESTLETVKKELKEIINYSNDFEECKNLYTPKTKKNYEKECIITSFKIFFYLAAKKNFSKGYNSIGKFLINNKIAYIDKNNNIDEEKTKSKGIEYLKKAVTLSNIPAMENLAMYYKKNNINIDLIKPLLLIGAESEDLISCVELSKVLMSEDKLDEAIDYLKYAYSQKSAYAQHNLAKVYENKFDYDNAKYWYKEAIKNGSKASAINLAQIYFKEFVDNNTTMKNSYLLYAINILNNNLNTLDNKHKEIANKLLIEWKKLLD